MPPAPADAGPVTLDLKPAHLVFEGGGVKGVAYVGALQVLGENRLLDDLTSIAGTSAGSITALAPTLGVFLGSLSAGKPSTDLLVFTEQVLETLLDPQVLTLCEDPGQKANRLRTAFLNPLNIGTTDFGISDADKRRLSRGLSSSGE